MRQEFHRYLRGFYRETVSRTACEDSTRTQPYWLLFPGWLSHKYAGKAPNRISRGTLNDILWGQYCVFLAVRIKDDLFDGQTSASCLLGAADHFLAEACNVFSRHISNENRFWDMFSDNLKETSLAIIEVDAMQRRRRVSLTQMRDGHARVSSIFKIGTAAVCCLAESAGHMKHLSRGFDRLAVAGQILDDFQDIDEDFRQGRLNYAARFILGASRQAAVPREDALHHIAERLLYSDSAARLFAEVIGHVYMTSRILAPLKLPEVDDYINKYAQSLERTADAVGRERARRVLGLKPRRRVRNKSGTT
jgi:hypothetical protein